MSAAESSLAEIGSIMEPIGRAAVEASRLLAQATTVQKNQALHAMAQSLRSSIDSILAANANDMASGKERNLSGAMLDRLLLDNKRIEAMAKGIEDIAQLSDPINTLIAEWTRPNGMTIQRVRVPLGVIGIIYESRPNVVFEIWQRSDLARWIRESSFQSRDSSMFGCRA